MGLNEAQDRWMCRRPDVPGTEVAAWVLPAPMALDDFVRVARSGVTIAFDREELGQRLSGSITAMERAKREAFPVYGLDSGFGSSSGNRMEEGMAFALQQNLVRYHGCGIGPALGPTESRAVALARLQCLAQGCSAVRLELLERLTGLLNAGIAPVIPEIGSVGASGDLTPLSYLAALIQGERRAWLQDIDGTYAIVPASEALAMRGIEPLFLQGREALAIMNGTAAMVGIAALAADRCRQVADVACLLTALLLEVTGGLTAPFAADLHRLKPHRGQLQAAAMIRDYLLDPDGQRLHRRRRDGVTEPAWGGEELQDRYSLRCAPQVIGPLYDALEFAGGLLTTELNGVADNPVVDPGSGRIFHGGHFYGGHVGMVADLLKIPLCGVVNLIDRQMALLMDFAAQSGLGENLVWQAAGSGPDKSRHGFKALQITVSALAAETLALAAPQSVLSRPTESGNQDIVSMGNTAARGLRDAVEKTEWAASAFCLSLLQAAAMHGERAGDGWLSVALSQRLRPLQLIFPGIRSDQPLDAAIEAMAGALFRSEAL